MNKFSIKGLLGILTLLGATQSPVQAATMKGWFEISGKASYYGNTKADIYASYNIEKDSQDMFKSGTIKFTQKDAEKNSFDKWNGWETKDIKITDVKFGNDWNIEKMTFKDTMFDPKPPSSFIDMGIEGMIDVLKQTGTITDKYTRKKDNRDFSHTFMIDKVSNTDFANKNRPSFPPVVNPSGTPEDSPILSVPEPTSTLGLLALGSIGAGSMVLKHRQKR
ncbi:PEP-CTERM sorting domain-containing protein [Dapis sp. BLCC M229]|uniref:PEP-CTERM sorting domain-containing protein n=1 Tax=Dapis sp. BLCC M229 TaxID=3400188 RepID=UPI003CFB632A